MELKDVVDFASLQEKTISPLDAIEEKITVVNERFENVKVEQEI